MNTKHFASLCRARCPVSRSALRLRRTCRAAPAPKDAELYIISPKDGETVTSPVTVRFGLRGMGIAPAGIAMENTGHHHLLIDADPPPFNLPIPADANHVHFGKGQTEATVTLAPGRHTPAAPARGSPAHPARPAGRVEADHDHRPIVQASRNFAMRLRRTAARPAAAARRPASASPNTTCSCAAAPSTTDTGSAGIRRAKSRSRATASPMSGRRRRARRGARSTRPARPSRPASSTCCPGRPSRSWSMAAARASCARA